MTPIQIKPTSIKTNELTHPHAFCSIVGELLYFTITRLDITFVVNQLSQWMSVAIIKDMEAIKRLLRHIKGSPNLGLFLGSSSSDFDDNDITTFFDSDWVVCQNTRRSIMGFSIYVCGSLISWQTKKQCMVSCPSTEAEYIVLVSTTCKVTWLTSLLLELHNPSIDTLMLKLWIFLNWQYLCRGYRMQSCIASMHQTHWTRDPPGSRAIRYWMDLSLYVHHVVSQENVVGLFTKSLPKMLFKHLLPKLHLMDSYRLDLKPLLHIHQILQICSFINLDQIWGRVIEFQPTNLTTTNDHLQQTSILWLKKHHRCTSIYSYHCVPN